MNLNSKILTIISTITEKNISITKPNDNLNKLGIDSLDKIEIILSLEQEFNINISDKEATEISNLKDIFCLIKTKIK